jgi:hypothetical protein
MNAYCAACNKSVAVLPMLERDALIVALEGEGDIEVMHISAEGHDHTFVLDAVSKQNLRRAISSGEV